MKNKNFSIERLDLVIDKTKFSTEVFETILQQVNTSTFYIHEIESESFKIAICNYDLVVKKENFLYKKRKDKIFTVLTKAIPNKNNPNYNFYTSNSYKINLEVKTLTFKVYNGYKFLGFYNEKYLKIKKRIKNKKLFFNDGSLNEYIKNIYDNNFLDISKSKKDNIESILELVNYDKELVAKVLFNDKNKVSFKNIFIDKKNITIKESINGGYDLLDNHDFKDKKILFISNNEDRINYLFNRLNLQNSIYLNKNSRLDNRDNRYSYYFQKDYYKYNIDEYHNQLQEALNIQKIKNLKQIIKNNYENYKTIQKEFDNENDKISNLVYKKLTIKYLELVKIIKIHKELSKYGSDLYDKISLILVEIKKYSLAKENKKINEKELERKKLYKIYNKLASKIDRLTDIYNKKYIKYNKRFKKYTSQRYFYKYLELEELKNREFKKLYDIVSSNLFIKKYIDLDENFSFEDHKIEKLFNKIEDISNFVSENKNTYQEELMFTNFNVVCCNIDEYNKNKYLKNYYFDDIIYFDSANIDFKDFIKLYINSNELYLFYNPNDFIQKEENVNNNKLIDIINKNGLIKTLNEFKNLYIDNKYYNEEEFINNKLINTYLFYPRLNEYNLKNFFESYTPVLRFHLQASFFEIIKLSKDEMDILKLIKIDCNQKNMISYILSKDIKIIENILNEMVKKSLIRYDNNSKKYLMINEIIEQFLPNNYEYKVKLDLDLYLYYDSYNDNFIKYDESFEIESLIDIDKLDNYFKYNYYDNYKFDYLIKNIQNDINNVYFSNKKFLSSSIFENSNLEIDKIFFKKGYNLGFHVSDNDKINNLVFYNSRINDIEVMKPISGSSNISKTILLSSSFVLKEVNHDELNEIKIDYLEKDKINFVFKRYFNTFSDIVYENIKDNFFKINSFNFKKVDLNLFEFLNYYMQNDLNNKNIPFIIKESDKFYTFYIKKVEDFNFNSLYNRYKDLFFTYLKNNLHFDTIKNTLLMKYSVSFYQKIKQILISGNYDYENSNFNYLFDYLKENIVW